MTWLVYTLIASLFWGVGQIYLKKGFAKISSLWNIIIATIICLVTWLPFCYFNGINLSNINFSPTLFFIIIVSIFYQIYFYALEKGEVSITGTIMAAYPLVTVILSHLFLGEVINWIQKLAIFVVLLGAAVISLPNKNNQTKIKVGSWIWWALASVILIGTADFLAKVIINNIGPYNYMFLLPIFYIPVVLGIAMIDKKGQKLPPVSGNQWRQLTPTLIGVFMIEVGIIAFNLAFANGPASLVGPLSSCYVAITVILAIIFLKEKVNLNQLIGIILTIIGIILFGVS